LENSIVNLEIIYEGMVEAGFTADFVPAPRMHGLRELRFYLPGCVESDCDKILYACVKGQCLRLPDRGGLLLLGDWTKEELRERQGYILCHNLDPFALVNLVEGVFCRYTALQNRLYNALNAEKSLQQICLIAAEHFGCPAFIHDEHFCYMASSLTECEMMKSHFDYNQLLECYMQDESTLIDFRVSDFNDVRCMYVNLFMGDNYRGRFLVDTAEATPGRLRLIDYFGKMILQALYKAYIYKPDTSGTFMRMIVDAVNGREIPQDILNMHAKLLNWNRGDSYICGMIALGSEHYNSYMILSICNSIQLHIKDSYPCYYNRDIYFMVNLSRAGISANDLRMKMSYLIREYMLHVGVSNVFEQLSDFPVYIKQAEITLIYSQEENLMSWYNEFSSIALRYWLKNGIGRMPWESTVARALTVLKNYDRENGTGLYETLKVFLTNERNSTLTCQMLGIHRSTLPHRLERIKTLTGANLDDFKTRLYLMMSFAFEDTDLSLQNKKSSSPDNARTQWHGVQREPKVRAV